jgi:hypothetical protein
MNKAVLLSAFVFPGSGHLLLKSYKTGISLMVAAILATFVLVSNLTQRATEIIDKIQAGEIYQLDVIGVSEMLMQTDTQQMRMATTILLILWIIGIVDSYRISRLQSKV